MLLNMVCKCVKNLYSQLYMLITLFRNITNISTDRPWHIAALFIVNHDLKLKLLTYDTILAPLINLTN